MFKLIIMKSMIYFLSKNICIILSYILIVQKDKAYTRLSVSLNENMHGGMTEQEISKATEFQNRANQSKEEGFSCTPIISNSTL